MISTGILQTHARSALDGFGATDCRGVFFRTGERVAVARAPLWGWQVAAGEVLNSLLRLVIRFLRRSSSGEVVVAPSRIFVTRPADGAAEIPVFSQNANNHPHSL